tara:strand:+ start:947 stop:1087 length:141 start_codon:yes stop_codon:yes gene_type:complete
MSDPRTKEFDYRGMFWDDVNKTYYRWHDLRLLMQERELKKKQAKED